MTKNPEFQQELNEKIKPGVKASDLKKLKRSKSADDLPVSKPNELENKISVLNLEIEVKNRELTEKDGTITIYSEQLKEKQKEVEDLRKHKEDSAKKIGQLKDHILELRLENIQDFGKYREKLIQIRKELDETVSEASSEITSSDDKVSSLRTKLFTASQQISSLQKDLNLAERLAELRKYPSPNSDNNLDYLKYAFYSLCAITLTVWLLRTNN